MVRAARLAVMMLAMTSGAAFAQHCESADKACSTKWSVLEDALFGYTQIAGEALGPEAARCLSADNDRWNAQLDTVCLGDSCRTQAYSERLSSLLVFLPEAEPVEGIDFATAPQLVTVLAPETGVEGADDYANPDTDVVGTLVHASADADHMGLAVRDDAGEHVMVFDMDIGNQPGHAVLQGLIADEPDLQFLVRGAGDDSAVANFRPNRCRLVYRMPIPDN